MEVTVIIEHKGKQYYKVKPDEKIKRNALHRNKSGGSYTQIIDNAAIIGETSSEFTYHDFFNPVLIKVKNSTKSEKFDIKNLYNSKK